MQLQEIKEIRTLESMNIEQSEQTNYLGEFIIGVGYLFFLCLAPALCLTFYYISNLQPQTSPVNPLVTSLPPTTPTPHIVPAEQKNAEVIFKDDFSDDSHGWADGDDWYKTQVTLGKLLLESLDQGYYATAECGLCPTLKSPNYLQADLSTGKETGDDYGIYFNYDEEEENFFLFTINPKAGRYYIYQKYNDVWALLASGESQEIKAFPALNSLGIYADQDLVELYVNGKLIDSYRQSGHSFHKGDFGFYADDAGFQLVVDNLIITQAGNH